MDPVIVIDEECKEEEAQLFILNDDGAMRELEKNSRGKFEIVYIWRKGKWVLETGSQSETEMGDSFRDMTA